ncbi:hypothetical protein [Herbaspirillum sp. NPDC087042]|uniref:hypothetical protein n=1 Tax=Herbaspirillum sp. NPDC087042 TaxID=3364004 RepID=UPI0038140470
MTQEQKTPNDIFNAVIALDMTARDLEVAKRVTADSEKEIGHRQYYQSQIPLLEQRFAEQYVRLWSDLPGIENSVHGTVAGIARTAMRAIARSIGVPTPA